MEEIKGFSGSGWSMEEVDFMRGIGFVPMLNGFKEFSGMTKGHATHSLDLRKYPDLAHVKKGESQYFSLQMHIPSESFSDFLDCGAEYGGYLQNSINYQSVEETPTKFEELKEHMIKILSQNCETIRKLNL